MDLFGPRMHATWEQIGCGERHVLVPPAGLQSWFDSSEAYDAPHDDRYRDVLCFMKYSRSDMYVYKVMDAVSMAWISTCENVRLHIHTYIYMPVYVYSKFNGLKVQASASAPSKQGPLPAMFGSIKVWDYCFARCMDVYMNEYG